MLKPTVLDISETNIAQFGTELEFKIKCASAEGEPEFKQFIQNTVVGTYLWRVHNFKLEHCDSNNDVATFFRGDSYLVLSITGSSTDKTFDIFYWIGSQTTLDEAGTAAYKAFELDNVLHTKAKQHREVCGEESVKFMSIFPSARFLDGGYDSGFHHVTSTEYRKRLLQVYTGHLDEVPMKWTSLRSTGIFILDCGNTVYQWIGERASSRLKASAMQAVRWIDDSRGDGVKIIVLTQGETSAEGTDFLRMLDGEGKEILEELKSVNSVDIETGRRDLKQESARVVKYHDGKFTRLDGDVIVASQADAIYIVDNGATCTVYGNMPLASLCALAYFTWAERKPCYTIFGGKINKK